MRRNLILLNIKIYYKASTSKQKQGDIIKKSAYGRNQRPKTNICIINKWRNNGTDLTVIF